MSDDAFSQTRRILERWRDGGGVPALVALRNVRVIEEDRRKIVEYAVASDSLILTLANALDAEHDAEIHGNIDRCDVCELLARAREWAR